MIQFLLKRIMQAALVMFIISMFCFSIQDTLGDPTREMAAMSMSDEERENLRDEMGLNDSLMVQYGRFVTRAFHEGAGLLGFRRSSDDELDVAEFLFYALEVLLHGGDFVFTNAPVSVGGRGVTGEDRANTNLGGKGGGRFPCGRGLPTDLIGRQHQSAHRSGSQELPTRAILAHDPHPPEDVTI